MMSKNDENFIAFCDELRAYVEEHHLFPDKHCRMSHKIKYTRKNPRFSIFCTKKSVSQPWALRDGRDDAWSA